MSYQLVVLMAGQSNRFQEGGYQFPKALLYANSKMILNRITDSFPNASEILVVASHNQKSFVNLRHSEFTRSERIEFAFIDQHDLGPSESILRAQEYLNRNLPIVISYCDVRTNLDDSKFIAKLKQFEAGAIVFSGFHPHTIRKIKFGYVNADSKGQIVEFKEKDSFSNSPLDEYASAGIYGFKSREVLLSSLDLQVSNGSLVNGEYYLSLAINELVKSGKKASILIVDCFASWGTPEDFEDFNLYARIQELCTNPDTGERVKGDTKLFLAGGQGVRSRNLLDNYKALLPLNNSNTTQLWSRSAGGLIECESVYFIGPVTVLDSIFLNVDSKIELHKIELSRKTGSSCETALKGLSAMENVAGPVSIIASDNLIGFENEVDLSRLEFDLLVWLAVRYPIADLNSNQYSWALVSDSDRVEKLSVKSKPNDGNHWYTIVGNFSFASKELAQSLISSTISSHKDFQELHLESVINTALSLGLKVKALLINSYMSVGVPEEILLMNYIKNDDYSKG